MKKDQVKNFTDHLNSIDDTNIIIMLYWTVRQNANAYIEPIGVKSYNNTNKINVSDR